MPHTEQAQKIIAQSAEKAINEEACWLYTHLIAAITAFQLGQGTAPPDEEFALWRAAQQKRLDAGITPQGLPAAPGAAERIHAAARS